jgi:hypothetical protein
MSLVDRAKNILLSPASEWLVIAGENGDVAGLLKNYACILALIPLVMGVLISLAFGAILAGAIGAAAGSVGFVALLVQQVVSYVVGLGLLFGIALIVSALSPSFNGKNDLFAASKLIVYSTTPIWLACVALIIPLLGFLVFLGAIVYAIYLVYLGANPVLGIPQEKVAGFTVVTILVYLVVGVILAIISSLASFGSPSVI